MGSQFARFTKWNEIKFFMFSALPKLSKFLKLRLFSEKVDKFFDDLLLGSMEYREKNNIVIPDMVNLLMQARKDGTIRMEDDTQFKDAGFATVEESESIHKTASRVTSKWLHAKEIKNALSRSKSLSYFQFNGS
jgi:hypothetical protein